MQRKKKALGVVVVLTVAIAALLGASWAIGACLICDGVPIGCQPAGSSGGWENCSAGGGGCAQWVPLCGGGGSGTPGKPKNPLTAYWW